MISPVMVMFAAWLSTQPRECPLVAPADPPAPPRAVIQPIGPPVGVRPWTPKTPTTNKKTGPRGNRPD